MWKKYFNYACAALLLMTGSVLTADVFADKEYRSCREAFDKCIEDAYADVETTEQAPAANLKGLYCVNGYLFCKIYTKN